MPVKRFQNGSISVTPPRGDWKQQNCFHSPPPYWFQLPTPNLSVLWYIAQNVADEQQRL